MVVVMIVVVIVRVMWVGFVIPVIVRVGVGRSRWGRRPDLETVTFQSHARILARQMADR